MTTLQPGFAVVAASIAEAGSVERAAVDNSRRRLVPVASHVKGNLAGVLFLDRRDRLLKIVVLEPASGSWAVEFEVDEDAADFPTSRPATGFAFAASTGTTITTLRRVRAFCMAGLVSADVGSLGVVADGRSTPEFDPVTGLFVAVGRAGPFRIVAHDSAGAEVGDLVYAPPSGYPD